jgi:hypothetical protein
MPDNIQEDIVEAMSSFRLLISVRDVSAEQRTLETGSCLRDHVAGHLQ